MPMRLSSSFFSCIFSHFSFCDTHNAGSGGRTITSPPYFYQKIISFLISQMMYPLPSLLFSTIRLYHCYPSYILLSFDFLVSSLSIPLLMCPCVPRLTLLSENLCLIKPNSQCLWCLQTLQLSNSLTLDPWVRETFLSIDWGNMNLFEGTSSAFHHQIHWHTCICINIWCLVELTPVFSKTLTSHCVWNPALLRSKP